MTEQEGAIPADGQVGDSARSVDDRGVVIVGGGLAGVQTALLLRRRGWTGPITMLAGEDTPPYDRPPLSKEILLGKSDDSTLPFDAGGLGVELRLDTPARRLGEDAVETDDAAVPYAAAVLATGAQPVQLPGDGGRYLRTRADALELRSRLRPGLRLVICGAGWIGAEVATAARHVGAEVTVLEQADAPVARALPATIGARMGAWYAEAGVELVTGATVGEVEPDRIMLTDGRVLPADEVLVSVGVRPSDEWLAGSPLFRDRGVVVGPDLRTDLASVYAAGDLAARWSPRYAARVRGEHWDDALRSPAVVVAGILGEAATYDPVPYVWSEQFGRMTQYAGPPDRALLERSRLVWRGDPDADATWVALWIDADERIVGVFGVDRPRDFTQARRLAERRTPVDVTAITDPDVAVKEAVARSGA